MLFTTALSRQASQNEQHIILWGGQAITVEDHTGWCYNGHRFTQPRLLRVTWSLISVYKCSNSVVPITASDCCSWLTRVMFDVFVYCCNRSASQFSVLRCFSAHHRCKECLFVAAPISQCVCGVFLLYTILCKNTNSGD